MTFACKIFMTETIINLAENRLNNKSNNDWNVNEEC